jgi:hypothetical protein
VGSVLFWSEGLSSEDMIKVIQKEKNSHWIELSSRF